MKIWEAGKVENSVTSPYEIDKITGSGYKCSECKNSKNFDGEFHLYRLYYKEDEVWDFDYEIDVPIHIECSECASENILIEYKKGLAFKYDNGVKTDNNQIKTEIIALTNITKESGYLYYLKCSKCENKKEKKCTDPASHTIDVWRSQMAQAGKGGGNAEKVADGGIHREEGYLYFINSDGNVKRAALPDISSDFNEILPNCLVLVSGNRLINFENSDGFKKLFKQLGLWNQPPNFDKVCLKAKKMINEMVDWEFNQAPFIDIENNVDNVISKIIVKNGMEQNSDGIDGIFDGGGTYKEFYVSKGF